MEKPYPLLVLVGGKNQVFCDVVDDAGGFTRCIPESKTNGAAVMPTNISGWLLLAPEETGEVRLWNAVTLQSIDLPQPPVDAHHCIDYVFLTKSPDNADCVLLLFLHHRGILHCHVNGEECDGGWTFQEESGYKFICPVACSDDDIFMSCRNPRPVLAKIETVKPKRLVITPDPRYACVPLHRVVGSSEYAEHWVACCGDLFMIEVAFGGKQIVSILVSKLDFSDMSWKTVNSCPNAAFFISHKQCLACPIASADSGKAGNRVYMVENEGKVLLHTYHIQQKTLKTCLVAAPPNNECGSPHWMFVANRHIAVDGEKDHLFAKSENSEVLMENGFEDLPVEIVDRFSYSFLENMMDYLNFRATCRWFREVCSEKEWRNRKELAADSPMPWLLFPSSTEDGRGLFCMMDPHTRSEFYVRTPEALGDASRICCGGDGLVIISSPCMVDDKVGDDEITLLLYNPITNSTICLPNMPTNVSHFLLGYDGTVPVFDAISLDSPPTFHNIRASATYESDQKWNKTAAIMEKGYEGECKLFVRQSNVNAVLAGSAYYFMVGDGNLAYISLEGDDAYKLKIHSLEEPCSRSSFELCFLVTGDNGDLLAIYLGKEWKWLRAFKFNKSDMVWDEIKKLENNAILFLSRLSSFTVTEPPPEIGNRIYFPRFYRDSIVYYSFNTNTFHVSDGWDSVMSDYYGSREHLYSCWFFPTC